MMGQPISNVTDAATMAAAMAATMESTKPVPQLATVSKHSIKQVKSGCRTIKIWLRRLQSHWLSTYRH